MTDENELIIRRAVFGEQVHQFLNSDICKYMITRAKYELEECLIALRAVDPTDSKAVMKFQNKVWVAESVQNWLADAVQDGLSAMGILEEREEE